MTEATPQMTAPDRSPATPLSTQRVIPIDSPWFLPVSLLEGAIDWSAVFGRQAPLALEIGCGIGHFITALAGQHPEINYLAIDIYNKGCLKSCRKLEAVGLTNVRIMRIEARELLLKAVPPDSLQAIYINCPDPWPKQRHRDRRLVKRDFLELALSRLAPEGELFFSSDQRDYVEEVAAALAEIPAFRNRLPAPFAEELPGYPLSKYMRRFLDQGLPVYFIHCRRDPAARLTDFVATNLQRGFRSRRPGP
jgi:tRNA (guanine-N7-)-methyltransferase